MRALMTLPLLALPATLAAPAQESKKDDGEWRPLFNGKDLDGWTPKIKGYELGDNHADTFRVEDGVIKVRYDKYTEFDGKFGHLFYKEKFSHYRLRVEYRFVGSQCKGGPGWAVRNSGVMFHCQDPKSMRKDQDFPVSVEFQLLGGLGKGNRPTANMCSPGTNVVLNGKLFTTHCTNSKSKTYNGDVWVTAEIEVNGGGIVRHYVEGELVLEYEQPQLDPKDADAKKLIKDDKLILEGGHIALQAESHPVEFRKVEIKVLKK
jgi:3-keto-disaccharide hydrolase